MSTRKLLRGAPLLTALLLTPLLLSSPASAGEEAWTTPLDSPLVVGKEFEPPEKRWLSGHRGVDLCPGVGATVRAPRAGTIIYAGKLADRNVISIRHSDGTNSTFEPVSPAVSQGSSVSAGTIIGSLEAGHDGNCLHWGVKVNRDLYLNPLGLIVGIPVLKPLDVPGA